MLTFESLGQNGLEYVWPRTHTLAGAGPWVITHQSALHGHTHLLSAPDFISSFEALVSG